MRVILVNIKYEGCFLIKYSDSLIDGEVDMKRMETKKLLLMLTNSSPGSSRSGPPDSSVGLQPPTTLFFSLSRFDYMY